MMKMKHLPREDRIQRLPQVQDAAENPSDESSKSQICSVKPGIYLSAQVSNPQRVTLRNRSAGLVLEKRSDYFVVMFNSTSVILVHRDDLEIL